MATFLSSFFLAFLPFPLQSLSFLILANSTHLIFNSYNSILFLNPAFLLLLLFLFFSSFLCSTSHSYSFVSSFYSSSSSHSSYFLNNSLLASCTSRGIVLVNSEVILYRSTALPSVKLTGMTFITIGFASSETSPLRALRSTNTGINPVATFSCCW